MALILVLACVLNLGLLLIACRIQKDTKLAKLVRTVFFPCDGPENDFGTVAWLSLLFWLVF